MKRWIGIQIHCVRHGVQTMWAMEAVVLCGRGDIGGRYSGWSFGDVSDETGSW